MSEIINEKDGGNVPRKTVMGAGCWHKETETQPRCKRGSECQTYGHIDLRHEKETAVVWKREKERRAREHTTSLQPRSILALQS